MSVLSKIGRDLLRPGEWVTGADFFNATTHRFSAAKGAIMHGKDGEDAWEIEDRRSVTTVKMPDGKVLRFTKDYRYTGRINTKPPLVYGYGKEALAEKDRRIAELEAQVFALIKAAETA